MLSKETSWFYLDVLFYFEILSLYYSITGLQQLVECLKSLSLALALCESEMDVQRAVYLSRLEQAYQTEQWGSVEWYHDIELEETQSRVAAASLFVHFCHDFSSMQTKQKGSLLT